MEWATGGLIANRQYSVFGPGKVFFGNMLIGSVVAQRRKSKGYRKHVREIKAVKRRNYRRPIHVTLKTDIRPETMAAFIGGLQKLDEAAETVGREFRRAAEEFHIARERIWSKYIKNIRMKEYEASDYERATAYFKLRKIGLSPLDIEQMRQRHESESNV